MRKTPFVAALLNLAGTLALGSTIEEDFEANGNGGFDPRFNHQLNLDHEPFFGELSPDDHWLSLAPGMDVVTFNLEPGQYVVWASATLLDYCGLACTSVEYLGTNGSVLFANTKIGEEQVFDTTALDLGIIHTAILRGNESFFDDLIIEVAPEPGSLVLFLVGVSACARRRPVPR